MLSEQIVNPTFFRPDFVKEPLYVITPVFNPQRYRTRWKLYKSFEKYVLNTNEAHLVTIECSYGNREKSLVEQVSDKHTVIYVQTKDEIWIKENLINLAIQRLPENWKYVAWIDADIQFARPDWVGECIQKLQHHHVIQMFSQAVDLTPSYEISKVHTGFMYCYKNNIPNLNKRMSLEYYCQETSNGSYWHPGFAWAARREAVNNLGGLIDWSILGGGDMYMAHALVGQLNKRNMPNSLGKLGVAALKEWQNRAELFINRNVGYMDGMIMHYWHGKKADRKYKDRGQILVDGKFSIDKDIKKDWQGLWQLSGNNLLLRDGIRDYFKQRNEDSIDV